MSLQGFFKEVGDSHTDCMSCRLISSTGILLCSFYVLQHRNNFGKKNAHFQIVIGGSIFTIGMLRLLALPPFTKKSIWEPIPEAIESNES